MPALEPWRHCDSRRRSLASHAGQRSKPSSRERHAACWRLSGAASLMALHVAAARRGVVLRASGRERASGSAIHRFSRRWFEAKALKVKRQVEKQVGRLVAQRVGLPQPAPPAVVAEAHWIDEIKKQRHQDRLWKYAAFVHACRAEQPQGCVASEQARRGRLVACS